ncbi:hypothetical protein [Gordonia sp. SCSIO 19800]|uniref:hypothetical protein n=1 Tax=Gordonia sp. SCSIO 19800 TaxID=2826926 RepID=UPI001B832AE6|nr:hypothetical protein [Gordonia sp. SCSIO 19800]MBR7191741.1 hypothetical protein [Gordonia sp. SCSIO 19800]
MAKPALVFFWIAVAFFVAASVGGIYGASATFVIPILIMAVVFLVAGQKLYDDQGEERETPTINDSVQRLTRLIFRRP